MYGGGEYPYNLQLVLPLEFELFSLSKNVFLFLRFFLFFILFVRCRRSISHSDRLGLSHLQSWLRRWGCTQGRFSFGEFSVTSFSHFWPQRTSLTYFFFPSLLTPLHLILTSISKYCSLLYGFLQNYLVSCYLLSSVYIVKNLFILKCFFFFLEKKALGSWMHFTSLQVISSALLLQSTSGTLKHFESQESFFLNVIYITEWILNIKGIFDA